MDHGAISGASPCGSGCKWEHRTSQHATASQNLFKDENWVQKEPPSQMLDFTYTTNPVALADFLWTAWPYLADPSQQGGTDLLFIRNTGPERGPSWHTMVWHWHR